MYKLKNVVVKNILNIDKLDINEKKITCIVGKSGGGKTTLLKLLNNMITCDKGKILYNNNDITEINPLQLRREIVMMPQIPVMFPNTIRDNFIKTLLWTEQQLCEDNIYSSLLNELKLCYHSLDTEVKNLSGGEKQRIALARILLLKPKVLLLDEPSSSLDDDTEKFIIEMVVRYSKENNASVVMITHSKQIAQKYAHDIITLNKGSIENCLSHEKKEDVVCE